MFPHSPNLNRKVWNRSHSLFSFFFSLSRTSVSFLPHLFPEKGRWGGCSREMMKFQGKVDVPSITEGGKVQINHLISPAFSPLSWGNSARGKSIKHHKWYMTQRSLSLYSGLCTYRTLALLSNNNSDQLPARWWEETVVLWDAKHWKFEILNKVYSDYQVSDLIMIVDVCLY